MLLQTKGLFIDCGRAMARKFPMRKRPTNKTAAGISWRAGAFAV